VQPLGQSVFPGNALPACLISPDDKSAVLTLFEILASGENLERLNLERLLYNRLADRPVRLVRPGGNLRDSCFREIFAC